MRFLLAPCLAFSFLLSGIAFAQEGGEGGSTNVSYKKRTVIDFSDVTIEGDVTKPEGSYLVNRKKTRFRNMIEVRANFRPELLRTVNAL